MELGNINIALIEHISLRYPIIGTVGYIGRKSSPLPLLFEGHVLDVLIRDREWYIVDYNYMYDTNDTNLGIHITEYGLLK